MFNLKSFFKKWCEIITKSKGLTRLFAYGEMVCFPVSAYVTGAIVYRIMPKTPDAIKKDV